MVTALDSNTALVLIDLQKAIVHRPMATPVGDVLGNAAKLVKAFRTAGWPIVIVNVNPAGSAWTKTRKDAPAPQGGALPEGWLDIVPEIATQPGDIFITKHGWNAFYGTALDAALKERGITGIVLGGISTSIGVEGTARAASELAYNITFAQDAMTDTVAEAHAHSLKYIFPRIGEVGHTAHIIEKMPAQ